MKYMSQTASKAVVSYIHKLIRANKFSHLTALIYDRILEDSAKPFLNKAQTEQVLSLLSLPCKHVPNIVSYIDLCVLLKDAYDEKFGNSSSDEHNEIVLTSENSSDEEAHFEELEVLSTLNTLRDKTYTRFTDVFALIRQENLIRTVLRQARRLRRMKGNLYEMERKMDYMIANYVAEKYCAGQVGEYSECDSGCHTDRSNSPNNSTSKLFVTKKEESDTDGRMNSSKSLQTVNDLMLISGSQQHKTMKLLSDFGKSLSDASISTGKPGTHILDSKPNAFKSSIKQTSAAEVPNRREQRAAERIPTELTDHVSSARMESLNQTLAIPDVTVSETDSTGNTTDQSDHQQTPVEIHQNTAGNEMIQKSRKKFMKLQLTIDLGFHDNDSNDQNMCKKIELKKYIEYDISSFWNKK